MKEGVDMRINLFFILLFFCFASLAQTPSILVYHEYGDGWGGAVIEAIEQLWPECTPAAFVGLDEQQDFNDALGSGEWDIIILECWQAPNDDLDWLEVRNRYIQDRSEVFVYNWFFWGSSGAQFTLYQAMGILDVAPSTYNTLIEIWDPDHPITQGISNWELYGIHPGSGSMIIRRIEMFYDDDVHAIAGWVEEWGGGICVAEDGESVVSGYCPAYAYEGVAIWMNILEFLYKGSPLQNATWGAIKAAW